MWWLLLTLYLSPVSVQYASIACETYRDCLDKQERVVVGYRYAALTDESYREGTYRVEVKWHEQPGQWRRVNH